VAGQIGLSLLLLTGAGLYVRSFANLTRINAGFRLERLLLVGLNLRAGDYAGAHPTEFYARTQDTLSALPGVQAASLVAFPLLSGESWSGGFAIRGHQADQANSCRLPVSETFFSTLGIPILQGRGFGATDTGDAPKVVVVNEKLARDYLPGENPVGQTFSMLGIDWRIVGVCRDFKYDHIKKAVPPTVYLPFRQMFFSPSISNNMRATFLAVRTTLPPLALSTSVRRVVAQIDPGVAVTTVTTQTDLRDRGISQERLLATLCGALGGLALFLACIGLYGLMAYNVARRAKEIAIRMAVGAQPGEVARSVLREALALSAIGIGLALPAAFALARLVKGQLYGVPPEDPTTVALVIIVLITVALLAAWIPARRAARVDPMVALRSD
jgi:predicted permease